MQTITCPALISLVSYRRLEQHPRIDLAHGAGARSRSERLNLAFCVTCFTNELNRDVVLRVDPVLKVSDPFLLAGMVRLVLLREGICRAHVNFLLPGSDPTLGLLENIRELA